MKHSFTLIVLAGCLVGCGSASSNSSTSSTTTASSQGTSNSGAGAEESDEQLLQRNLDECFAAAERNPERRDAIRPVCLCIISGGTDDPQLLRDLRAADEQAMTARAQACATPSRILPFATLDQCLTSRPGDYDMCGRLAACVGEQIQQQHAGPDFDAWFTSLTPEQRHQLGVESGTTCIRQIQGQAQ
jgi:hypothetical protein